MKNSSKILYLTATLALLVGGQTLACSLNFLPLDSTGSASGGVFTGTSHGVEVQLTSAAYDKLTPGLKESPLLIKNHNTQTQCTISQSGISSRDSLLVSNDGQVFMADEGNSSTETLKFYNTRSCKQLSKLDVSNAVWKSLDTAIQVVRADSQYGVPATMLYPLDNACLPEKGHVY